MSSQNKDVDLTVKDVVCAMLLAYMYQKVPAGGAFGIPAPGGSLPVDAIPVPGTPVVAAQITADNATARITGLIAFTNANPTAFVPYILLAKDVNSVLKPHVAQKLSDAANNLPFDAYYADHLENVVKEMCGVAAIGTGGVTDASRFVQPDGFSHGRLWLAQWNIAHVAQQVIGTVAASVPEVAQVLGSHASVVAADGINDVDHKWGPTNTISALFALTAAPIQQTTTKGTAVTNGGGMKQRGGAQSFKIDISALAKRLNSSSFSRVSVQNAVEVQVFGKWFAPANINFGNYLSSAPSSSTKSNALADFNLAKKDDRDYEISINNGTVTIKNKNGGKVEELDSIDIKNPLMCDALGLQKLNATKCSALVGACDGKDPSACLNQLIKQINDHNSANPADKIDVSKAAISRTHPAIVSKFLQRIDWPKAGRSVNMNTTWQYAQKFEVFQEHCKNTNRTLVGITKGDDVSTFLENCAVFVNKIYPEILNPSQLKDKGVEDGLQAGIAQRRSQLKFPISYASMSSKPFPKALGIADILENRTRSISRLVGRSPNFRTPVSLAISLPRLNGGAEDEFGFDDEDVSEDTSGLGLNKLNSYYKQSLDRLESAFTSMGKKLHPDVKAKMDKTFNDYKQNTKDFVTAYERVKNYSNINKFVSRDSVINPNIADMDAHNKTFENTQVRFTKSEINLAKVIAKLQESLHDNVKKLAENKGVKRTFVGSMKE